MPSSLATFHQPSALGPLLDALATLLTWQFSLFLANLAKAHNWFTSTFLFYIFFSFHLTVHPHTQQAMMPSTLAAPFGVAHCWLFFSRSLALSSFHFLQFEPTNTHTHPYARTQLMESHKENPKEGKKIPRDFFQTSVQLSRGSSNATPTLHMPRSWFDISNILIFGGSNTVFTIFVSVHGPKRKFSCERRLVVRFFPSLLAADCFCCCCY